MITFRPADDKGAGWYYKVDPITIGGFTMYEIQLVHKTPDGRIDRTQGMPLLHASIEGAIEGLNHKLDADPMPPTIN